MEAIFFEISVVLITGTVFATIAKLLRQPMIPAYILAGVFLGPPALNILQRGELLEVLSTFGIAFLLFLVGMELDLRNFLKIGRVAITIGIVQMAFALGAGFLVNQLLGFDVITSFFLAAALGFSSTIVVLKLLGERKELDTLFGQIVIGLMLTQDFIAVMFLIFFEVFVHSEGGGGLGLTVLFTLIKGAFLFALAFLASRYILRPIFKYFARSPELLFLGAISWCLVFAMLSLGLGFSIEVGALLAGVSLSFLPYTVEISGRVKSLRDFFLPIFFAVLGAQLVFSAGQAVVLPTVALSSLVLFGSPILVIGTLLWFGYTSRTSFQAGMAIGQVSEFSFILISLVYVSGMVSQDIVGLVALIGLVTMTVSTYMIEYNDPLYAWFQPILKKLERKSTSRRLDTVDKPLKNHIVLIGHHTMGFKARLSIERLKQEYVVVDYNPDVIQDLQDTGINAIYGSQSDPEVLEKAYLSDASMVISTVPDRTTTTALLSYAKHAKVKAIVTAFDTDDAIQLYKHGASFVIYPTELSGDFLQELLQTKTQLGRKKTAHLKELKLLKKLHRAR